MPSEYTNGPLLPGKASMTAQEFKDALPKARNQKREEILQIQIAKYLRLKYPNVIFRSDVSSGMRLPMFLSVKAAKMQSGSKFPDMCIFEARHGFNAMLLELKKSREEIYTKSDMLRQSEHIQAQAEVLRQLRVKGFSAEFYCGFDEAVRAIDAYLR